MLKCREFLRQNLTTETVEANRLYRLLGVRLEGKGPFIREEKIGSQIRAKKLQRVKEGDFVYSRLFAWRGAFGLISEKMDGAFVSNEFPNFKIDENRVYPKFLEFYFKQERVWNEVKKHCTGTTKASRNRFKEKFFLDFVIAFPALDEQKRIVNKLQSLIAKAKEAQVFRKWNLDETEKLVHSTLRQILDENSDSTEWEAGPMSEFVEVNPSRRGKTNFPQTMPVSFVPMAAVDDITGRIVRPLVRPFAEVSRGYTWFKDGDVIFARITPCMQNGKAALAEGLKNSVGFGSTEFHVLRPGPKLMGRWLHYLVRHRDFRDDAERHFKGTAGQQRVPQSFLEKKVIPVPPLHEQRRIVNFLDSIQAALDESKKLQAGTEKEMEELVRSLLDNVFKGEF